MHDGLMSAFSCVGRPGDSDSDATTDAGDATTAFLPDDDEPADDAAAAFLAGGAAAAAGAGRFAGAFGGRLGFGGGSFACLLRLIDAVVCCAVDVRRERSAPGSFGAGGGIIFFFGICAIRGDRSEAARRRA